MGIKKIEKSCIKGISKSDERCVFTVLKDRNLAENIYHFLKDIGFDMKYLFVTEDYYTYSRGERFEDLTDYFDVCKTLSNNEYRVDIFLGLKKCFLVVWGKNKQQYLSEAIHKYFYFT